MTLMLILLVVCGLPWNVPERWHLRLSLGRIWVLPHLSSGLPRALVFL